MFTSQRCVVGINNAKQNSRVQRKYRYTVLPQCRFNVTAYSLLRDPSLDACFHLKENGWKTQQGMCADTVQVKSLDAFSQSIQ